MKFISDFREGDNITGVYLCKQKNLAQTKNGKDYENLILSDKTGSINSKIWEPNGMGIGDFEANDYIEIHGRVSLFNGALQLSVDRAFKASEGSFDPADYVPVSQYGIEDMYKSLLGCIDGIQTPYFKLLLEKFFVDDTEFIEAFKKHSAAKSVHHGFMGGLLQHTLFVCRLCEYYAKVYPKLNHDLLITAAMCHDIGKVKEISDFPQNSYTDCGQLLGHIVMGVEMVDEKLSEIKGFPEVKANELKHCIISHHGEFEFGSPKKPAIMEAVALNFADNLDAKMECFTEILDGINPAEKQDEWLGFNKIFDSNIRPTK